VAGRNLTDSFREIIEWHWSDFVDKERDDSVSNFDSVLIVLIRACAKSDMRAIKEGLNRLDGKVAERLQVEYPKFYLLFPNASKTAGRAPAGEEFSVPSSPAEVLPAVTEPDELPTGALRPVLERILDAPKTIVSDIMAAADKVDNDDLSKGNPYVKSVIIAGLMRLVHKGRMNAVLEVLEQIDGKVADKIKLLGEDVYVYNYAQVAPAGAVKNAEGVYQLEADIITNSWATRLEGQRKK
jgi:hypothetical protein